MQDLSRFFINPFFERKISRDEIAPRPPSFFKQSLLEDLTKPT